MHKMRILKLLWCSCGIVETLTPFQTQDFSLIYFDLVIFLCFRPVKWIFRPNRTCLLRKWLCVVLKRLESLLRSNVNFKPEFHMRYLENFKAAKGEFKHMSYFPTRCILVHDLQSKNWKIEDSDWSQSKTIVTIEVS